jgi:hypothetical protein
MIGDTVAFDPCQITAERIGMNDAEVDAEVRDADLRVDLPAPRLQGCLLEVQLRPAPSEREGLGQRPWPTLGELQEMLEVLDVWGTAARDVDLLRPQRREDTELAPGSGDGHVQPPVPALAVQGADGGAHASVRIRSDRD